MNLFLQGYGLIKKKFKNSLIILGAISLIGTILDAFSIVLILPFMELLINPSKISENSILNLSFFFGREMNQAELILYYSIIILITIILKNIFVILINYNQSKILLNINFYLSNLYFTKILNLNFLDAIEQKSSQTIRTMIHQTNIFSLNFINSFNQLLIKALTLLFMATIVITFSEKYLIQVLSILFICLLLYYFFFKKKLYSIAKNTELAEVKRLQNLTNGVNLINEISIFNIKKYFIDSDNKINQDIIRLALKTSLIRSYPRSLVEIVLVVLLIFFIFYISFNNLNFIDVIPSITFLAAALFKFVPAITSSMILLQRIEESKPSLENICQKLYKKEFESLSKKDKENFNFDIKDEIKIKNLSYSYNNSKKLLFNNVNLKIKKGDKIAIYGKSGAGKTTLVKLLMGIIPLSTGEILVDDMNIKSNTKNWQSKISYIPQKVFLFEATLKENIMLFNDSHSEIKFKKIISKVFLNEEEFQQLSKSINNIPSKLSGGETKKVGIARALYKNHDLLIIDEGTAGLDKNYINHFISEIIKLEKTIVFITHDLNLLKNFDKVYKIEDQDLNLIS